MEENLKYNRQILWFGVDGQEKIESTKVAVVGVGGTGSHVIQQLAYLGVKTFVLIDSDTVKETNLNRLIGASNSDIGKSKVEIGKRSIEFINPSSNVTTVADTFISEAGVEALKGVDFIFGCMDKEGGRLLLTEFCKAYEKPYLDIATEISEGTWGGRTFFSDTEAGCLECNQELAKDEVHRDLSTPEDRSVDDKIYGVSRAKLQNTGPSVVSLNGILASLAITEFMVHITSIRKIRRHLEYRGNMGIVVNVEYKSLSDCYYCKGISGIKDKADMGKYVRQGIDKILR